MIADLEARVRRTLQGKDDTIVELKTRCAASENKVHEFEYLLARQREELLGGLTRGGAADTASHRGATLSRENQGGILKDDHWERW